jgi:3-deoxy-D-manno-octulosonate 8-phosphate phosphatase KdsC-like HAD superfamily phosphatase
LEAVGAAFVPADAARGVCGETYDRRWHVVNGGGGGALRDVCEVLLRARGYDVYTWPVTRREDA